MSAETLRKAAALMRERAAAAMPGPWWRDGFTVRGGSEGRSVAPAHNADFANAAHIASWHPAVALAVADWLDSQHERITDTDYDEDDDLAAALRGEATTEEWPDVHAALAVARAYLGVAS